MLILTGVTLWFNEIKCRRKERELNSETNQNQGASIRAAKNVHSPRGLKVFVSAGPEQKPLPASHDDISIVEPVGKRRYACAHSGAKSFALDVYGEITKTIKQKEECPICMQARYQKHVVRCALCGLGIAPGDGVALYGADSLDVHLEWATRINNSVIGCMRWDCCPSGGFFVGNWSEAGLKPRFENSATATESLL